MRRAEQERTTSTSGESGLSGPQSRLGLVRAKPSPSSEFIYLKKKRLQLCGGWVAGLSVSYALLPCLDDGDELESALACSKIASHDSSGDGHISL